MWSWFYDIPQTPLLFSVSSLRYWALSRWQLKSETIVAVRRRSGGANGTLSSVNFLPKRLSPYCIISYNFAAAASPQLTFDQSLSPIRKYFTSNLEIRRGYQILQLNIFHWHKKSIKGHLWPISNKYVVEELIDLSMSF